MAAPQRSAFFEAIGKHDPQSTAIIHSKSGRTFTYGSLLADVANARNKILETSGKDESAIAGERVAFLIENGYDYVVNLLACLAVNAIAVPLAPSFPASELRYVLNHSESLLLLSSSKFEKQATEVLQEDIETRIKHVKVTKIEEGSLASVRNDLVVGAGGAEGGLMLFTSGTTARPKGVVLSTSVLTAQCGSLKEAWDYSPNDHLLHVLPLHHIHGTVNALLTPLFSGSSIEFMYPFNPSQVWNRFALPFLDDIENQPNPITFFTAVPTIWARMLQTFGELEPDISEAARKAIKRDHLRLNISGSAALPTPTRNKWTDLSDGNILLERFGMTEVGMALSCGLADEDRIDGSVGWPLPSVEARLVDPDTNQILPPPSSTDHPEPTGEIQLRGPTIFQSYWRNPEATRKEFTHDGWFRTGDIAVQRLPPTGSGLGRSGAWAQGPAYFIQGRSSADIIKTGGEKVSALEIERELLSLPEVRECAVVALPSEAWGQKVAAVVVLTEEGRRAGRSGGAWGAMDMRRALKGRLVAYKIPQDLKVVEEIPRNAMGKVNKKELVPRMFGDREAIRRRSVDVAEEREELKKEGAS